MTSRKDKSGSDGLLKDGTSRRKRAAARRNRPGTPRIMLAALLVVLVGAALLFWPRGGSVPTGIGESQTVVTAPSVADTNGVTTAGGSQRSGDVDIEQAARDIKPEQPEGATAKQDEPAPPGKQATPAAQSRQTNKPAAPPPEPVVPSSDGSYAVQVGAFGDAENADEEAARLLAKGWDARVRAGNNSAGKMVFRVWIGYFASRDEAQKFIQQNRKAIPGAIPVHR